MSKQSVNLAVKSKTQSNFLVNEQLHWNSDKQSDCVLADKIQGESPGSEEKREQGDTREKLEKRREKNEKLDT